MDDAEFAAFIAEKNALCDRLEGKTLEPAAEAFVVEHGPDRRWEDPAVAPKPMHRPLPLC